MGGSASKNLDHWSLPAHQFLDRQGIGVLVEVWVKQAAGHLWIRVEGSHRPRAGFAICAEGRRQPSESSVKTFSGQREAQS
jgi:hypothetical protein